MEKQILELLQQMDKKLTVQGQTLEKHTQILTEHSRILGEHSQILGEHSRILGEHGQILEKHSLVLADHGQLLNALRHGQESLKAEISELRLQNAKEFGEVKEQIKNIEISNELLKEDNWNNKKDIRKIQRTMGMV
ncbi:hypothetical protein M670_00846 [Schinkia azotoformans MEV2011]|uniref:Uncharacterized protein n=1 Tax=Schinkia azotoformans MEV2011 TaxID=1348973 RepID=A0A072NRG0_SCHAZ|nr:hypothetical protein [Schinkia azotoformans]KEF39822.1 hypothetical protein M670_00846 [Schinkia azotoformans MEV2011]MEC1697120.1 hypothetical protein [Schinkia azotoformans]MEC1715347.1 hypothetical protein [Schinkia azotoformans]MEC1724159.1 hypothetical protein [Schinkia azotoformans]MEC1740902.1 hypothetical protein [Schinkia azotoformans]